MLGAMIEYGPGAASQAIGAAMLAVSMLVVLFAPRQRHFIESLAFGLPFAAALPVSHDLFFGVALLSTVIFQRFFADNSLSGLPFRVRLASARSARIAAPASEIWARLVPGDSHPDDHWTGTLIDFDTDAEDPDSLNLRYRTADALFDEVTVTFLIRDHPKHCRYYIERSEGNLIEESVMDIRLTEIEPGLTLIRSELRHEPLPIRAAMTRWLDDCFGDEWDSFAATLGNSADWSLHRMTREPEPPDTPHDGEMIW